MNKTEAVAAIREAWQQRDDVHCISDEERQNSASKLAEALAALGVK